MLWPVEQVVAVSDWGFASEALFRQFVPGSVLAYEDTNSFYRAFRHWTGVTPEAARTDGGLIATA